MKCAMFAVALLTVGCFSLPIFAQQQDLQEVMNAANALGARENELLGKKDAAGIASLFTSDGLLVMLAYGQREPIRSPSKTRASRATGLES
jgi:hypothetical protein